MVLESGLQLEELHIVQRSRRHASGEEAVDFTEASSFGNFLRMVPEGLRESFRVDLAAAFEARRGPEGIDVREYVEVFVASRAR